MEAEVKGYSDSREEEEEEEAGEINIPITRDHQLESNNRLHHQQDAAAAAPNFINHRKQQLDFMDLSLATTNTNTNSNDDEAPNVQLQGSGGGGSGSSTSEAGAGPPVEKEHMFDKVVTPSDVGKLNRLVIPKQHAEKYFPLDSSSNDKGLLLNFEDRNGKLWRFRYSYWNSSQSYVMTKGWSRFVKEKKLDAGDIVSFQRGLGEHYRHRLYIDWRRRPDHPPDGYHHPSASSLVAPLFLPNHYSIRWGGRLYSLPSPPAAASSVPPPPPARHHDHYQQHLNYSSHMYAFQQQQQQHHQQQFNSSYGHDHQLNNPGSGSVYYLRSTPSASMVDHNSFPGQQQQERGSGAANIHSPMIIDSVPVAHHHHHHHHQHQHLQGGNSGVAAAASASSAGKRLRLFGVNMECASSSSSPGEASSAAYVTLPPNSLPSSSSSSSSARFGDQRGEIRETSVLFDLDPSLQYRQQQH